MTPDPAEPGWVADPTIPWRILLTAALRDAALGPDDVQERLAALAAAQGWPLARVRHADDARRLAVDLASAEEAPVVVGLVGRSLVVSAHHAHVDGLGLLDVLSALTGADVRSSARGVGDRDPAGRFATAAARRLAEVALAPPATVAALRAADARREGDVLVEASVPGEVRTARLVHAAVAAVVAHHARPGRRARRVAVAVGAGRPPLPGDEGRIADRSALIRLRDVERCSLPEVEAALRAAPLQPAPSSGGAGGRVVSTALRVLSRRLGSTLLVSHLGAVTAPGVEHLAFHPVTAGGTGLSLGAVGLGDRTVLGLRARASSWDDDGLEQLLEAVVAKLG